MWSSLRQLPISLQRGLPSKIFNKLVHFFVYFLGFFMWQFLAPTLMASHRAQSREFCQEMSNCVVDTCVAAVTGPYYKPGPTKSTRSVCLTGMLLYSERWACRLKAIISLKLAKVCQIWKMYTIPHFTSFFELKNIVRLSCIRCVMQEVWRWDNFCLN